MRAAIVNYVWSPRLSTPETTLDEFETLTGWAEALDGAGVVVSVFQRFPSDAETTRGEVPYVFRADRGDAVPRWWFAGCDALHHSVALADPDIVHVNGLMSPVLIRALRRALPRRTPIVVQDHGGVPPDALSPARRRWRRAGLSFTDALLVATAPQVASFRASGLVPRGFPVHNVMEGSTRFTPMPRAEARRLSGLIGDPAVLSVGRLNANKDPECVLHGFAAFAKLATDAHLTFVYADGALEPQVRHDIDTVPDLASRVSLRGYVPHQRLPAFYSAADLFVSGSHAEGSGYAALEAMACGAIPVLTDIPAFRGLTAAGRIGAVWARGDAGALADALSRTWAATDDALRAKVRARFEQNFSWDAIGARACDIYDRVVAARRIHC